MLCLKKVRNINNPRKLIPAKKSLNEQTAKINTREMLFFFQKEKTAKISTRGKSTIKVVINQSQAVARRCSVKKVFLEISQISQENNFFGTFEAPHFVLFFKKIISHVTFY